VKQKRYFDAEYLTELRVARGLSRSQLARHIGVTQWTICLYESYGGIPDKENLKKLSKFFEIEESDLGGVLAPYCGLASQSESHNL